MSFFIPILRKTTGSPVTLFRLWWSRQIDGVGNQCQRLHLSSETAEVVAPTPISVVKDCFVQFADFSGTASRYQYWWFLVFVLLLSALAEIISPTLKQFITVLILLPFLAVGARRLNEAGQNVWWQLMYLVPFGVIVVWYFMAQPAKVLTEESTH